MSTSSMDNMHRQGCAAGLRQAGRDDTRPGGLILRIGITAAQAGAGLDEHIGRCLPWPNLTLHQ